MIENPDIAAVEKAIEGEQDHWDREPRLPALWFDSEGCGPIPIGDVLRIRARMYSTYYPKYPLDDTTVKVMLEADALGGIFLMPADARELAAQILRAANNAEAEYRRLAEEDDARCDSCDGTGDLTRADGEYMGRCSCEAKP